MTSFLWVQRDHNVAKIVCHSASRRNGPLPSDRQNASSNDTTRRPTLAACHTAWARGHTKNKCEQSSTTPTHSGHSTGVRNHLLPQCPRHQASSCEEPSKNFDLQWEATLPYQTVALSDERVLRYLLFPKKSVGSLGGEPGTAPHPHVRNCLHQAPIKDVAA